jgi:hypothetical protein
LEEYLDEVIAELKVADDSGVAELATDLLESGELSAEQFQWLKDAVDCFLYRHYAVSDGAQVVFYRRGKPVIRKGRRKP